MVTRKLGSIGGIKNILNHFRLEVFSHRIIKRIINRFASHMSTCTMFQNVISKLLAIHEKRNKLMFDLPWLKLKFSQILNKPQAHQKVLGKNERSLIFPGLVMAKFSLAKTARFSIRKILSSDFYLFKK